MKIFRYTWQAVIAISTWVGIIYLPSSLWGLPEAYPALKPYLSAFSRLQLLAGFTLLLVAYVSLRDVMPAILRWRSKRIGRPLSVQPDIYVECETIEFGDVDEPHPYWATYYYLMVGNQGKTGKTLRNVQCRVFHFGPPNQLLLREDFAKETDIRHGEWVFFCLGRIVSYKGEGFFNIRPTKLGLNSKRGYDHNVAHGQLTFEFCDQQRLSKGGLSLTFPKPNGIWSLMAVLTADDEQSRTVTVSISSGDSGIKVSLPD